MADLHKVTDPASHIGDAGELEYSAAHVHVNQRLAKGDSPILESQPTLAKERRTCINEKTEDLQKKTSAVSHAGRSTEGQHHPPRMHEDQMPAENDPSVRESFLAQDRQFCLHDGAGKAASIKQEGYGSDIIEQDQMSDNSQFPDDMIAMQLGMEYAQNSQSLDFDIDSDLPGEKLASASSSACSRKRKIQGYWFIVFPWLEIDFDQKLFFCKYCRKTKKKNVFTEGRTTDHPKKDHFVKHEQTADHIWAAAECGDEEALSKAREKKEERSSVENPVVLGNSLISHQEAVVFPVPGITADNGQHGQDTMYMEESQKQKRPERRQIKKYWFIEYPWLEMNGGYFFCKVCREAKNSSVFAQGKPIVNPKKDHFAKHSACQEHQMAMWAVQFVTAQDLVTQEDCSSVSKDISEKIRNLHWESPVQSSKTATKSVTCSAVPAEVDRSDISTDSSVSSLQDQSPVTVIGSVASGRRSARKIQLKWFVDFPWLELDEIKKQFFCKLCKSLGQPGVFCTGKSALNPKRDNFMKHEDTEGHRLAVLTMAGVPADVRVSMNKSPTPRSQEVSPSMVKREHMDIPCENSENISDKADANPSLVNIETIQSKGWNVDSARSVEHQNLYVLGTQAGWFLSYKWLEYEEEADCLYCKVCRLYHPHGVFAIGKLHSCPTQEHFAQHEETEGHQFAMRMMEAVKEKEMMDSLNASHNDSSGAQSESYTTPPRNNRTVEEMAKLAVTCVKLAKKGMGDNQIRPEWFVEFPWLEVDTKLKALVCKWCKCLGRRSLFSVANLATTVTRQDILDHVDTISHKMALKKQDVPDDVSSSVDKSAFKTDLHRSSGSVPVSPDSPLLGAPWTSLFWPLANQLRQLGILCDVTLSVSTPGGDFSEFKAHKLLLVCASEFFKSRLQSSDLTDHYHFTNITPTGMEGVLQFIYGQSVHGTPQDYKEYLNAAEVLLVPKFKEVVDHLGSVLEQSSSPSAPYVGGETSPVLSASQLTPAVSVGPDLPMSVSPTSEQMKHETEKIQSTLDQNETNCEYELMDAANVQSYSDTKTVAHTEVLFTHGPGENVAESESGTLENEHDPPPGDESKDLVKHSPDLSAEQPLQQQDREITPAEGEEVSGETMEIKWAPTEIKETDASKTVEETKTSPAPESGEKNSAPGGSTITVPTKASLKQMPAQPHKPVVLRSQRKRFMQQFLPSCNICGKKFLKMNFLQRHKEVKHYRKKIDKMFKCEECGKTYPSAYKLRGHQRRHTGERPYLCTVCGKSYRTREVFSQHMRIHKDRPRPWKCKECGKCFMKQFDMERHYVGMHSPERPFQCHECGKSFSWARSLQDHIQRHAEYRPRPFRCEECSQTFARKFDLTRHAVTHSKEKPFQCDKCGHGFTQKGSLEKHKREYCKAKEGALPAELEDDISQTETINFDPLGANVDPSSSFIFYSL